MILLTGYRIKVYNDCVSLSVLSDLHESSTKMNQLQRSYQFHTVVTIEEQDVFAEFDWSDDNEDGISGPVWSTMKVSAKLADTDNPLINHWVVINGLLNYKQWDCIKEHIEYFQGQLREQTEEYL